MKNLKKVIVVFFLILIAIAPLKPKAQYVPVAVPNYQAIPFIIPWFNQANDTMYLIRTANHPDTFTLFFWDTENLINDWGLMNINSSDFTRESRAVEESLYINWGGGSDGLALVDQWELYIVSGASYFPPYNPQSGVWFYGTEYGSVLYNADYNYTIMNSNPVDIFYALYNVYNAGYSLGFSSATTDLQEAYSTGYAQGFYEAEQYYNYEIGVLQNQLNGTFEVAFEAGYQRGYSDGFNLGINENVDTTNWIMTLFLTLGTFLAIELFGGITLGAIVGIPLFIGIGFFVLKIIRG